MNHHNKMVSKVYFVYEEIIEDDRYMIEYL
jgi:hypothetical protein